MDGSISKGRLRYGMANLTPSYLYFTYYGIFQCLLREGPVAFFHTVTVGCGSKTGLRKVSFGPRSLLSYRISSVDATIHRETSSVCAYGRYQRHPDVKFNSQDRPRLTS